MSNAPAADALDKAGEDAILAAVADGMTIGKLARQYGVSRRSVYNWINAGGKERRERFEDARRQSADAYVERAEEALEDDAATASPQHAALAKERANHYRWTAGKLDRTTYGDDKAALSVNLNVQSLHLDALRQVGNMSHAPQIPEAEVLEIPSETSAG